MQRDLPNQLTMLRLILAAVFFVLLNQFRYGVTTGTILWVAMAVFIIAALTDVADGYLARKWQVESTFGRIMDPFVDKVLNIGAFIYLSGPRFVDPRAVEAGDYFTMVSGIYPWMVVLILARELLVTGVRGEMESHGIQFGAKTVGKLKTLLQCIGIPFILGIVALDPELDGRHWMKYVRESFAYGIVLLTLLSGIPYVTSAISSMRGQATK